MASVDNRVVRMEFDNRSFEQRVGTTTKSLEKLKASLDFSKSSDSLKQVNTTANNFNLNNMSNEVSKATSGFSVLSGAAAVALGGIAAKAAVVGAQIVKSLTLAPLMQGFQEYETNMNAIQTILANTRADGTSLEQVNAALAKLNEYSDQTIYNFAQMARNIGTFTAAGVDLDSSVNAIKGIANLAAISGSNSEQASTAMYQLSQALASGTVKLMDWNSVVNAGMGGEVFQKALFETGKALGTIKDVPIDRTFEEWTSAGNSFRETLQDGWITSEVLTNTLSAFTGDLTEQQLLAIGYTQQQAKEFLALGASGKAAATEVKTITQLISTVKESIASGWSNSFKIVLGDFNEAKTLLTGVNNVISNIVQTSSDARNSVLEIWKFFGGRDLLITSLSQAFKNLGNILLAVKKGIQDVFPPTTAKNLYNLTTGFQNLVKALTPSEETLLKIQKVFRGFAAVVSIVFEILKGFGTFIGTVFSTLAKGSRALGFFAQLGDVIFKLRQILVGDNKIEKFFKTLSNLFSDVVGSGLDIFFSLLSGVSNRLGERFGFLSKMGDPVKTTFSTLSDKAGGLAETMTKVASTIKEKASTIAKAIGESFSKNDFSTLLDSLNVALFGGFLLVIRKFFKDGLKIDIGNGFLANLSGIFTQLTGVIGEFQKSIKADTLMKIAKAMLILAASVLILSLIDSAKLTAAVIAVGVLFGILTGVLTLLDKIAINTKKSVSIGVLVLALIGLSAAMLVLAVAARILGGMEWENIIKGLVAFSALIVGISAAVKNMPDTKDLIKSGFGILILSFSIKSLAKSVKILGEMSWEELSRGLLAVTGLLGLLVVAINKMPPNLPQVGFAILGLGLALLAMGYAVSIFGNMDLGAMAQGIGGIAAVLAVLAIAVNLMASSIAGAISIALVAGSLILLSFAIKAFSDISWGDLLKGLGMIAGILIAIAIAANLLAPAIPAMLALGLSLVLIGAGMALLGAGLFFIAKTLQVLVFTGTAGIKALVDIFDVIIKKIPELILAFTSGLIDSFKMLISALPDLISGLGDALILLIQKLRELLPDFILLVGDIISGILTLIRDKVPEYVATGLLVLVSFLDGIRKNIGLIVVLVAEIIVNFLNALSNSIPKIVQAGKNLIIKLIEGISELAYLMGISGLYILIKFVEGISKGAQLLIEAGVNLIIDLIKGIGNSAIKIVDAATETVKAFCKEISENTVELANAGLQMILDILTGLTEAVKDKAPKIREQGIELAAAIIDGMTFGISSKIGDVGKKLGEGLSSVIDIGKGILGISSPSKVFKQIGKDVMSGFAIGISDNKQVLASSKKSTEEISKSLSDGLLLAAMSFNNLNDLTPVITPVLDLTEVERGAARLNEIVSVPKIDTSLSFGKASSISASQSVAEEVVQTTQNQIINEIKFEQTINSPTTLSASEIYRNTKTQIAMAKEELKII